jgi:hypothetical protein
MHPLQYNGLPILSTPFSFFVTQVDFLDAYQDREFLCLIEVHHLGGMLLLHRRSYELMRQTKILISAWHSAVAKGPCPAGRDWKVALPSIISADLPLGAWTHTPVAPMVRIPISSHRASAFPATTSGRLPTTPTQWRVLCGFHFEAAVFPLYAGPQVCSPPWLPPQCLKQSGSDFYLRADSPSYQIGAADIPVPTSQEELTAGDFNPIRSAALLATP